MTTTLMSVVVNKERQEISDFWVVEEGLPGEFNKERGFQDSAGEMHIMAIQVADPDVPHTISAADVISSVLAAMGIRILQEDFQIDWMENSCMVMWWLTTCNAVLVEGLLAVGGGLMNLEEYYFTSWINFDVLWFMVNAKGIPIQVKPPELVELIEGY